MARSAWGGSAAGRAGRSSCRRRACCAAVQAWAAKKISSEQAHKAIYCGSECYIMTYLLDSRAL